MGHGRDRHLRVLTQPPVGIDAVKPGDTARVTATLEVAVALEEGTEFRLRQAGRTVGAGAVTRIVA
ncbi:EF-Tu C-terminal domain-related protein [Kitasatospora acidiphila]|uniref:EF-Tu C-terminal domain-related protein n=1 Tax=Kitasatospora acidiphila TaxID=2567942 RepID=UPI003898E5B3